MQVSTWRGEGKKICKKARKSYVKGLKGKWKIEEIQTESLILSTFASPVLGCSHDPWAEPDQELVVLSSPVCWNSLPISFSRLVLFLQFELHHWWVVSDHHFDSCVSMALTWLYKITVVFFLWIQCLWDDPENKWSMNQSTYFSCVEYKFSVGNSGLSWAATTTAGSQEWGPLARWVRWR